MRGRGVLLMLPDAVFHLARACCDLRCPTALLEAKHVPVDVQARWGKCGYGYITKTTPVVPEGGFGALSPQPLCHGPTACASLR